MEAGVDEQIEFRRADVNRLLAEGTGNACRPSAKAGQAPWQGESGIVLLTNLPYGIRIGEAAELERIYGTLREKLTAEPTWNLFAITADKTLEEAMGRKADRRRKLYNGNIETTYYQFHGEKRAGPEP